ncbi:MAG TPA: alpha/beta hydrolase [Candidatus Egerieimonas intestinavium]|uniref:Alpha/beta hydrolase n=1 Tax=Candidatus Egerieimonas intestinavium TaxID=2840777 RepID=A0A9D1ELF3_9FIRM|nr:alpha/beta hydrolase [Candidatus Egerieimonas intestinavium]
MKKKNLIETTEQLQDGQEEYYIFHLNENVKRMAVTFRNRYGIELSGDLYTAQDLDTTASYPALVIGPPYGGVKEQGPGVYANEMAQRGFVVLTFDPSFNGESGGEPRHASSPDIFTEDFSSGVDYLGTLDYVDRQRIGAIGICGSGGFALAAAQVDTRIKAVATASLFDVSALGNGLNTEAWFAGVDPVAQQRWADVDNGTPEYIPTYPETPTEDIPEELESIWAEFYSFYGLERGHHPRALGGFTTTSNLAFYNFQLLDHLDMLTQPVLFMAGENAETRPISETAYGLVSGPKELCIVPDANHVDLYDDTDKIPFDTLVEFFNENMS